MTHLFFAGKEQFEAITSGELLFDVSNEDIGLSDRVIYQEVDENNDTTGSECERIVTFMYPADGLKKGYIAFQFKEKES